MLLSRPRVMVIIASGSLFLPAFPSDLCHMLSVAADFLAAFSPDLSHMFTIAAHCLSSLAGGFRPVAFCRARSGTLLCHIRLHFSKLRVVR